MYLNVSPILQSNSHPPFCIHESIGVDYISIEYKSADQQCASPSSSSLSTSPQYSHSKSFNPRSTANTFPHHSTQTCISIGMNCTLTIIARKAVGSQDFTNVTGILSLTKSRGRLKLCRQSVAEEQFGRSDLSGVIPVYFREDNFACRVEDVLQNLQDMGAVGIVEIANGVRGFSTYWYDEFGE